MTTITVALDGARLSGTVRVSFGVASDCSPMVTFGGRTFATTGPGYTPDELADIVTVNGVECRVAAYHVTADGVLPYARLRRLDRNEDAPDGVQRRFRAWAEQAAVRLLEPAGEAVAAGAAGSTRPDRWDDMIASLRSDATLLEEWADVAMLVSTGAAWVRRRRPGDPGRVRFQRPRTPIRDRVFDLVQPAEVVGAAEVDGVVVAWAVAEARGVRVDGQAPMFVPVSVSTT